MTKTDDRKIRSASPKTAKTAGALAAKKAVKPKPVEVAPSPQTQPEDFGYPILLSLDEGEVRIVSGCRDFSFSEARAHWSERSRATDRQIAAAGCSPECDICRREAPAARDRARSMLALLPKLKRRARGYGWLTATKVKRAALSPSSR